MRDLKKKSFSRFTTFIFFAILLSIMFFNINLPVKAAAIELSGGDSIISGGVYQLTEGATGIIEIATTEPVTIIGNILGHSNLRIRYTTSGADLSIQDLKITLSSYAYSALTFTGNDNILHLIGKSDLSGASSTNTGAPAVVAVASNTDLTIEGGGQLTVTTKSHGAGIGGTYGTKSGNITILNTTVYAYAGAGGSAIGAAYVAAGGDILIQGSNVTVETIYNASAPFAAGIGGGSASNRGGKIDIFDSTVTAVSDTYGAAIGTGVWGYGTDIHIKNSTVTATSKRTGSAAIGDCYGTAEGGGGMSKILIEDSTVTAKNTVMNTSGGAAIGGGYGYSGGAVLIEGDSTQVVAIGGDKSAGIGGAYYSVLEDIVYGGSLTLTNMPSVKAYSNVSDGAVQGLDVNNVPDTNARIVHGSLHESLVDPVYEQNIMVADFLGVSNEFYVLTLPAGYVSFAVHTTGTALEGKYISRILKNDKLYVLGNTDYDEPVYLYLLGAPESNNNIFRIVDLKLLSEVIFDLNYTPTESEPPASQIIEINGLATRPENPERTNYTFNGWYKESGGVNLWDFDSDTVNGSITLFAQWILNEETTFTVSFDSRGGSNVDSITGIRKGTGISPPADPTRFGYIFGGWYKDEVYTDMWDFDNDMVEGDITLFAKWYDDLPPETGDNTDLELMILSLIFILAVPVFISQIVRKKIFKI